MEDLQIERGQPANRKSIVKLLASQASEHRMHPKRAGLIKVVDSVLADDQFGFILVARRGRRIVGVAYLAIIFSVEHGGRVGWLEELYVTPKDRGLGIGSALLEAVISLARQEQLTAIDLEVDAEHRRAESLYARSGFRELSRSRWVRKGRE